MLCLLSSWGEIHITACNRVPFQSQVEALIRGRRSIDTCSNHPPFEQAISKVRYHVLRRAIERRRRAWSSGLGVWTEMRQHFWGIDACDQEGRGSSSIHGSYHALPMAGWTDWMDGGQGSIMSACHASRLPVGDSLHVGPGNSCCIERVPRHTHEHCSHSGSPLTVASS
jgi:hypothetical protein